MGRGVDNYYLILELDFLKPETDMSVINNRIKEKVKFWNANSERDRKRGAKYRQYKSQVIDIGKVMGNEASRTAEAKDAKAFVQGILGEEMKFFSGKKEIEKAAAEDIMERCGLWPDMFEKMTGLKISEAVAAGPAKDPNPKVEHHSKFRTSLAPLAFLDKSNLYEFLANNDSMDWIDMQTLDGEELIKGYANPLKEQHKNDRTDVGTSVATLCSLAEEIFDAGNTSLKKEYDQFLIWQKKDAVISRMVKYSGAGKTLDAQQQKLFVDELTQIERSREKAAKTYQAICSFKGISGGSGSAQEVNDQRIACPHCYVMVDISHGERKCTNCGSDLYIKCPKCKKEIAASLQACGYCGFVLEDIRKVETFCRSAKTAIANMDFAKARNCLAKAERLFPGYDKISVIKSELEKQENSFSKEVEQLADLVKKRCFYKAYEVLKGLQRKVPTAKISGDVLIENAVAEAERLYKEAVKLTSENELIRACTQIVAVCADYPGVDALVLKYPPAPVSNVKLAFDTKTCANTLTWEESRSQGEISYKIIRKENTAAASLEDGTELGAAGIPRFVDNSPEPGVDYYYSVYTMRAGIASKPVFVHGVNMAELIIIGQDEGDGCVKIEWKPVKNASVEVWRSEGDIPAKCGLGTKITAGRSYVYDEDVQNDHKYGYRLAVKYMIGGKPVMTEGVTALLIPTSIPEPVDDLTVTNVSDDIFEAEWTYAGSEKISLYCTDKRTSLNFGDTVDIKKLTAELKPVEVVSASENTCRFRIRDDKKYSIIPVTIKHNMAVIGEQAMAAKIEKIKIKNVELLNSELEIKIDWPKDASSILVLYGEDGYAKNISDRKGKTSKSFSKNLYDAKGAIYLTNIEKKTYYITLYSACKLNGELMYSDGTQVQFGNVEKHDIQYSIKVKGFFSKKQVEMEFKSAQKEFLLPDIDIVAKRNGPPVYASSGMMVEHIDGQRVTGSYILAIPVSSLPSGSYIKAFFTDDDMNDEIRLRPVVGTDFKVS